MQIFITRGGEKSGPFTLDRVREQLDKGDLMPDDLACQEGGTEWIPLSELMSKLESSESTAPESSPKRKTLKKIGKILAGIAALAVAFVIYVTIEDYLLDRELWGVEIGYSGQMGSPPVIGSDGTVYVRGDKLLAMNGETGDVVWEFDYLRNNKYEQSSGGAPAIGPDGTLYFGGDGRFFALNSKTGEKKWEMELPDTTTPAIDSDGNIIVGFGGNTLIAIEGATRSIKWEFQMGKRAKKFGLSSPSISADGTVYIVFANGKVYALDGKTGTMKWEFVAEGNVITTPVVGKNGTVIVGSDYGKVYGLNGQTGAKEWEFKGSSKIFWPAAIGGDGTVYIATGRETFVALDGKTGSKKWEYKKDDINDVDYSSPRWSPPVIGADGTIYVGGGGDGSAMVYALDGRTGAKKWEAFIGTDGYMGEIPDFLAIGKNATLYARTAAWFTSLKTDDQSSGSSPWPMFGQNAQHTARPPAK
jgi:outer membrane protein assembly factor BamB